MKKILLPSIVAIICLISVIYSSCIKNACLGVSCQNGGYCSSGSCVCPTGYSGNNCEYDACYSVTCQNNGYCSSGYCVCPTGYTGTYCENATTGNVSFYTTSNYGYVSVYVSGYSATITSYYPSGINYCNSSGCANFTLSPGTYSFSASSSSGSWSGYITINAGGCLLDHLN